jgi:aminopeptidase N
MPHRYAAGAAALALSLTLAGALTGCTSGDDTSSSGSSGPSGSPSAGAAGTGATGGQGTAAQVAAAHPPTIAPDDPALDAAVSDPVRDDVYPDVGDPGVDALHYDLDLSWSPGPQKLQAVETLVFRATGTAQDFRLDLGAALDVASVTLEGRTASYEHDGKELVVHAPVTADQRYTLVVAYGGTPLPAAAPTTRSDFSTVGWTTNGDGSVWTMQEPYGAYTWYAVNDQPSDKALYDFTIRSGGGMVGIANGTLESRRQRGPVSTTRWHLDEPASSYLTTIAIGHYMPYPDKSASGVPVTYWLPASNPRIRRGLKPAADQMGWLENKLGPFPFSSLGIVLVNSRSGMETQTMLTLGMTDYTTSPEVIVHEMAHQWYGDEVTPATWSGLWMSEGMAMYLQGLWQSEHGGESMASTVRRWRASEHGLEESYGKPAAYDPATFGESNAYYGPAVMWDALRHRLGDAKFWSLVRAWPRAHEDGNATYDDITSWWSQHSGQDLRPVFDSYLLGKGARR